MLESAKGVRNVTIVDLYERYPTFDINVAQEQQALQEADVVIWQHPFFWYSAPPLLKQWIDLVLTFGWAYGPGGTALAGKKVYQVISTGGTSAVYAHDGRNRYTIHEFLRPFEQTARLCGMEYGEPFTIQGTHMLTTDDINNEAGRYQAFLELCTNEY